MSTRFRTRGSASRGDIAQIETNRLAIGGGGGDDRTYITRTFTITQSQIAAKGVATTSVFALFTLAANEGIRWAWWQTQATFTGTFSGDVWAKLGHSGDPDALLQQKSITDAGTYDNGDDVGVLFGANQGRGKGSSVAEKDTTAQMGGSTAITVDIETTGGAHNTGTGGGALHINVEIVRYDPTQLETTS